MSETLEKIKIKVVGESPYRRCMDYDHECPDVKDKAACWLYQPERGYCPFLAPEPKE